MKFKLILISFLIISSCSGQKVDVDKIKQNYSQGNYNEVIKICTPEINKLNKSDTLIKTLIGFRVGSYMRLLDFKSAIEDYKLLIDLEPKNVSNYSGISYAFWSIGDTTNGLKYLQKAHQITPNDPLLLSNLSYDFSQAGKYKESIEYASKGLSQNPDNKLKGLLLNNRGFSYMGLKKLDLGLKDINESILLFPENSYAYYYRALANIELKKMNTVCNDLEKARDLGGVEMTKSLLLNICGK